MLELFKKAKMSSLAFLKQWYVTIRNELEDYNSNCSIAEIGDVFRLMNQKLQLQDRIEQVESQIFEN